MLFSLIVVLIFPIFAGFSQDNVGNKTPHVQVRLVTDGRNVSTKNELSVGVVFEIERGWHIYWRNPGESGIPTKIKIEKLPPKVQVGEIQWPTPKAFGDSDVLNIGYEDEVVLIRKLSGVSQTQMKFSVLAEWLVCEKICIPGETQWQVEWDSQSNLENHRIFDKVAKTYPTTGEQVLSAERSGTSLRVQNVPFKNPIFFSYEPERVRPIVGTKIADNVYDFTVYPSVPKFDQIKGILSGKNTSEEMSFNVRTMSLKEDIVAPAVKEKEPQESLVMLLLFAFVGGLILNLMPCVFPVLSLKVLGLAKSPLHPMAHGISYTLGVLGSFWILAGSLLVLRAGGEALGWGFQLQSPGFVYLLMVIFFLIGLNMLDVISLGTPAFINRLASRASGPREESFGSSFFTGILAVFVATPCTAPFMGSALGAAITLPPLQSMMIFTSLGFGLATPFLFLAAAPGLLRWIPKPGRWMEMLKQAFAFPMFATCAWLIWVGVEQGSDVLKILLSVVLLSFGIWILQKHPTRSRTGNIFWAIIVLFIAGSVGFSSFQVTEGKKSQMETGWEKFSDQALRSHLEQGKPVFLDFTAAWCLTCKVNEKLVLSKESVLAKFKSKDVILMKGDWTNRDAEISRKIQELGRSGVPVYALYRSVNDYTILPETLTVEILDKALATLP